MSPTKHYKTFLSLDWVKALFKRSKQPVNGRPKGRIPEIPDYLRKDLGPDPLEPRRHPTHPPRDPPVKDPFSLK